MHLCLWGDVIKRQKFIIFIDFFARKLASHDFAKDCHRYSLGIDGVDYMLGALILGLMAHCKRI